MEPGNERLKLMRSSALPETELLVAENCSRGWHVYHERYAFSACQTAASPWRYRSKEYLLRDQSVAFMEPGEVHRNTAVYKSANFKVLFVEQQAFGQAAAELGARGKPHFRSGQVDHPHFFAAVYALAAAVESGESVLEQQSRYTSCVRMLLWHAEQAPRAIGHSNLRPALQRAKQHLLDRYDQHVTLDELAAVSGLTRFTVLRAFTANLGLPPHAFQIHVRIERSLSLLLSGLPAGEVATRLGFSDQSHFTRHFRRIMGMTPGDYIRRVPRKLSIEAAAQTAEPN